MISLFDAEVETPLETAIVMLIGMLVPIMAASLFYIGDRRRNRSAPENGAPENGAPENGAPENGESPTLDESEPSSLTKPPT